MLSFIRKNLLSALWAVILLLSSCNVITNNNGNDQDTTDSLSLRIALLPIQECNVLRHAIESNLANDMQLPLQLLHYDALMDIDTAIISSTAHVYFEDSLRISRIQQDSLRPKLLMNIPVRLMLIANKDKDIQSVAALRTNMVALTRWSQMEEWLNNTLVDSALDQTDVYHAQINSIPLRYNMLNNGLIDAAILPQPWADSLLLQGHHLLMDTILHGMGLYISPAALADSLSEWQSQQLRKLYLESMKDME